MVPLSIATTIALRAHRGQTRRDGTAFIEHPLAVARILMRASTHLPSEALAVAILHDVLEDTSVTYDDLAERVGHTIAIGVLALTRPPRLHEEPDGVHEQRYLAQIARASILQPYLLLIKMADRIHNLETAISLAPDRREELRKTTEEYHIPFLHSVRAGHTLDLLPAYETLLAHLKDLCEPMAPALPLRCRVH
jgi:GTP diphosphokinase / guanosine-3',5'-bis(diphosphate) 3'-diphosphatase